ncbi:hypothetical protein C3L50_16145 [Flavobacterium alvei]|uniref:Uncharacterized protein n=1 Tax=Flavobacterium alvei TaxID=2080416 RepID=A0A2S4ZZA9_9FLAO|nr:hypothetical protein [Flavobacterium alvei]POY35337.1 hypothetical protein C3L50_16145 [Flavobacterium alvei]
MKKNTLNLIVNPNNNFILFQTPLYLNLKRVLLFVIAFYSVSISAQVSPAFSVKELKLFISDMKLTEKNSNLSFSNAQNVENLVYTIQPSIYLYSGNLKTYGEKPTKLYTDISSLNGINNPNLLNNNIEIVEIKIDNLSNLNSKIDLSVFSNFEKLKYIYILSRVSITEQNISSMILNYDEKYSIFYKVDKGE